MLSHYERRELRGIEEWFEATEPKLAEGLRRCRQRRTRRASMALLWIALHLLAAATVVAGALMPSFTLIGFGIVAFVAIGTAQLTRRSELRRSRRALGEDQ